MKNLPYLFFVLSVLFFISCDKSTTPSVVDPVSEQVELPDGFYYLNGTDFKYAVRRKNFRETYVLNPAPIFMSEDFESIVIVPEKNGKFSLDFEIDPLQSHKWEAVLKSPVHYVGYVHNKELRNLIKIKGKNSRDEVFLNCIGTTFQEAENMVTAMLD